MLDTRLPLIVGLTTLPSRLPHLRPTLDSLKGQTLLPDKVLLCLPRVSRRERVAYQCPDWLADYAPMLQVVQPDEDDGPGTKLLGCLQHLPAAACVVVVIDDDMRYRPSFLHALHAHQSQDLRASFSYWTYRSGPFVVGQGADGFSFYSPNLLGVEAFAARALRNPQLSVVDDLWISAFLHRQGVAVKSLKHLLPPGESIYEPVHTVNQLHDMEGDHEREAAMHAGVAYMLETGMMGRAPQVRALLKRFLRAMRDRLTARDGTAP